MHRDAWSVPMHRPATMSGANLLWYRKSVLLAYPAHHTIHTGGAVMLNIGGGV